MGFFTDLIKGISEGYTDLSKELPFELSGLINVFIFAVLIALYAGFTYKFYRYLSKKDLIELNLAQYNKTNHPGLNKFFATILYLLEYIIILPFLIFFWFGVLTLIILVLSENQGINQVVVISAAMVTAVRMLAYLSTEDLSRDLAKIFPFTILTIFLLDPGFFSLERILTNLTTLPNILNTILYFLILIIAVELILRVIDTIIGFFRSDEETPRPSR